MTEYQQLSDVIWHVYDTLMSDNEKKTNRISISLMVEFFLLLKRTKVNDLTTFTKKLKERRDMLLEINNKLRKELLASLPIWCHEKLTDLNSAVIGIPNDTDSDLEFTIAIESKDQQETIHNILKNIGYQFENVRDDNIPHEEIKWMNYIKHYNGVEIEVKVRWKKIVDSIMIAHNNIKNNLSSYQKIKVSYIKSILAAGGDMKTYKTFKYIIYGAMFQGHQNTIIFRHN